MHQDTRSTRDPYSLPDFRGVVGVVQGFTLAECKRLDVDPAWWFPDEKDRSQVLRAASFCKECAHQRECLNVGLFETNGIWGGLTHSKRVKLRRKGGPSRKCKACGSLFTWVEQGVILCGECGRHVPL